MVSPLTLPESQPLQLNMEAFNIHPSYEVNPDITKKKLSIIVLSFSIPTQKIKKLFINLSWFKISSTTKMLKPKL